MIITARAPMRIDFAGGTIDIPPLFLFHYPAPTINAAVQIFAKVTITPSDQLTIISKDQDIQIKAADWRSLAWDNYPMLELACRLVKSFQPEPATIEIESEAPAGSGLGGSSVIAIALTAALAKFSQRHFSDTDLVEYAKSIETQSIKVPTGYQDYWGAYYGGINAYQIELDGSLKRTALGSEAFRAELEKQLMLVYVGKPHFSGINNWDLVKKHIDGDGATNDFFEKIKKNGIAMQAAFKAEDLSAVAQVLNDDWQVRKSMLPTMTTPEIETLTEQAMAAGALAARVCGAGAGGCLLMLVPPEKRSAVQTVVDELGMKTLNSKLSSVGVEVGDASL